MADFRLVALSGGVGGAKLAYGLSRVLAPEQLTILTNTADDFEHLGLWISPDLDSVMYALAELNNTELGWGVKGETWQCMAALARLQSDTWFRLGDQDIATHLLRSQLLRDGKSLTEVTQILFQRLGLPANVLPMCDAKVSTLVDTEQGEMAFQHYFVKHQCQVKVEGFRFQGIEEATLNTLQEQALQNMDALLICPSNPFVSIAPILAVPQLKALISQRQKPIAVVSPIIAGQAVKGPAAKMLQELNMPVSALAVADYYQGFASHFVLDEKDRALTDEITNLGYQVLCCNTLMSDAQDKIALAKTISDWLYAQ